MSAKGMQLSVSSEQLRKAAEAKSRGFNQGLLLIHTEMLFDRGDDVCVAPSCSPCCSPWLCSCCCCGGCSDCAAAMAAGCEPATGEDCCAGTSATVGVLSRSEGPVGIWPAALPPENCPARASGDPSSAEPTRCAATATAVGVRPLGLGCRSAPAASSCDSAAMICSAVGRCSGTLDMQAAIRSATSWGHSSGTLQSRGVARVAQTVGTSGCKKNTAWHSQACMAHFKWRCSNAATSPVLPHLPALRPSVLQVLT